MTTYIFNRKRTSTNLALALVIFALSALGLIFQPWRSYGDLWTQAAFNAIASSACGTLLLNVVPYLVYLRQFRIDVGPHRFAYRQWWISDSTSWEGVSWQKTYGVGSVLSVQGRILVIPAFLPGYRDLLEAIRRGCSDNNPPLATDSRLARTAVGVAIRHGDEEALTTLQDAVRVDRREAQRLLGWIRFAEGRVPAIPPVWTIYLAAVIYYSLVCVPLTIVQHDALTENQHYQALRGGDPPGVH